MRDPQVLADERDAREEQAMVEDVAGHMTAEEFGAWLMEYRKHNFVPDEFQHFTDAELAFEDSIPF